MKKIFMTSTIIMLLILVSCSGPYNLTPEEKYKADSGKVTLTPLNENMISICENNNLDITSCYDMFLFDIDASVELLPLEDRLTCGESMNEKLGCLGVYHGLNP